MSVDNMPEKSAGVLVARACIAHLIEVDEASVTSNPHHFRSVSAHWWWGILCPRLCRSAAATRRADAISLIVNDDLYSELINSDQGLPHCLGVRHC